jgi:hypothetical protein
MKRGAKKKSVTKSEYMTFRVTKENKDVVIGHYGKSVPKRFAEWLTGLVEAVAELDAAGKPCCSDKCNKSCKA